MGFVTQYGQEQEISATWNFADITFGNANFSFNSLTATVIIDNTTTLSEINIDTPVYTNVPDIPLPTYTAAQVANQHLRRYQLASLQDKAIKDSYKDLLTVAGTTANEGLETTAKRVFDGEGIGSPLYLGTNTLDIVGTTTITGDTTMTGILQLLVI